MTCSTASRRSGSSASAGTWYGMRASRILPLARTMRCASVGADVRNARAICSVSSPHTSRSVSAMRASALNAGWQQVKIRRRRSSSTPSSSSAGPAAATASSCSATPLSAGIEPRVPPQLVDRLESSGRDEPRARVVRHAVARPRIERRRERVVHRFLGPIEIAEQSNQRGQHAARIGPVDRPDRVARACRFLVSVGQSGSPSSRTPRSAGPRRTPSWPPGSYPRPGSRRSDPWPR